MRKVLALAFLTLAAACAHGKKAAAAPEAKPAEAAVAPAPGPALEPAPLAVASAPCTSDEACADNELCLAALCTPITSGMTACQVRSPHFDFDRATLHDADLPPLRRAARCLASGAETSMLVEGNCDERGTTEYNLALGLRRAGAVREYIEGLGVSSDRIATVSYGKELPVCTESEESCWARNRRADLLPGGEAKDIAALVRASEARERDAGPAPAVVTGRRPAGSSRPPAPREAPAASESPAAPGR